MTSRYTAEYWDHERDLRKHEPRPSDPVPDRLRAPISEAIEVAVLVRAVDLMDGAKLIEQYAQTVASAARLQAVIDATDRFMAQIDKFGASNAPA